MFNGGYGVAMLYISKWSFWSTKTAPAVTMSVLSSVVFVMGNCAASFCWILAAEFVSWAFAPRHVNTSPMARLVVRIARKAIMGSSSGNNYLGNWTRKGGRPGCYNVPRGHAPY